MKSRIFNNILESVIDIQVLIMNHELNKIHEAVFELYFYSMSLNPNDRVESTIATDINNVSLTSRNLDVNFKRFEENLAKLYNHLRIIFKEGYITE